MSTITPELVRNCQRCSRELTPGALECTQCHALVYAKRLDQLAGEARALEAKGELLRAREQWLMSLPLLPQASNQADWIKDHARQLEASPTVVKAPPPENNWAKKVGPLGALGVLLAKGKFVFTLLLKLKFLLSLVAFMGVYWALYGPKFGIGFAIAILIHEMGHYIEVKRRGLPAEMPVFLPGFGAYVRWQAMGVSLETRAAISLAGPAAGWLAAAVCALLWWTTGNGIWGALARAGAWLNLLNLIPVWMLDGGHAALALSKAERAAILIAAVVLGVFSGEGIFFLVALGAAWRLFTKDTPPQGSRMTMAYFIAILSLLALVMSLVPGQGRGFGTHSLMFNPALNPAE